MTPKLNRILQIIFITGTATILGFAGIYAFQQQQLLRKMKITFAGVIYDNVSLRNFAMRIKLKFQNLSDININVESYDFDVLINGQKVMKLVSPGPGLITAHSESINVLNVHFDPKQSFAVFTPQVIIDLLFDYSKLLITLSGKMTVSHIGIGVHDLPVNQTSRLSELMQS